MKLYRQVALLVSAWIEITLLCQYKKAARVALLVSAWIEILAALVKSPAERSHSS